MSELIALFFPAPPVACLRVLECDFGSREKVVLSIVGVSLEVLLPIQFLHYPYGNPL